MEFEWDERKASLNELKHGVPFDYATRVFLDLRRIEMADERGDYREERRLVLGKIAGRLFVVVYTLRGGAIRLISARKANERERRIYEALSA